MINMPSALDPHSTGVGDNDDTQALAYGFNIPLVFLNSVLYNVYKSRYSMMNIGELIYL